MDASFSPPTDKVQAADELAYKQKLKTKMSYQA